MTARYRVQHTSRYDYDRSVAASMNEARVTPLQTAWQMRLESSIAIDPVTWNYRYTDYWGTEVRVFEVSGPHRHLDIRATSLVEIDATRRPDVASDLAWPDVRNATVHDELIEYLTQTPVTEPPAALAALAEQIAADNPPAQAARLIAGAVHDALTYLPGVTEVRTTAVQAWAAGRGVCQDYTHLVVGALRHVGLPARYVSGYLYPGGEPQIGDSALGESHAWVEWWLGEWAAYDPTNASAVGERHVMVGTGRDYGDVPPIKGIVAGQQSETVMRVTVELTRLA
ncbi:transglutaminase domain-containing protein [uncultured Jatrophihabitans sp.]|uniref:transglutaminase family protein n=1 Tax=uncultured Jatrophihabitans sp. TaxID=1610747 RepID=UPI0035CA2301